MNGSKTKEFHALCLGVPLIHMCSINSSALHVIENLIFFVYSPNFTKLYDIYSTCDNKLPDESCALENISFQKIKKEREREREKGNL